MKKFTLLFIALFSTIWMWATDVTVIDKSKNATTYGSLSGTVFTTNATSGMAGVTVSGIKGTTATNFAYGACLALTSTASGTITITAPEGYIILGYSLTARSNTWSVPYTLTPSAGGSAVTTSTGGVNLSVSGLDAQTASFTYSATSANSFYIPAMTITVVSSAAKLVNVTYELYEADGTTLVTSKQTEQEENSAIDIPASLTSSDYFNYAAEGTIGSEDCTIKVTRTLKNPNIVYPINLSNNKAYTLTTERGSLGTNGTQMVSTFGTSYAASNFAIISYEDKYYLYSVADSKFVGNPTTIDGVKNQPILTNDLSNVTPVTFSLTTAPRYFMGMGSNGVNVSNYATGIVVNSWTTLDAGNQYLIEQAADFDPTDALAALEEYFHPSGEIVFNGVIEQLEAMSWGTGLCQYCLTGEYAGYTSQAAIIIDGLKQQGYTENNLAIAQNLLANSALNMPKAGEYLRIKGTANAQYIGSGSVTNGKYSRTDDAEEAIVYFDGTTLRNVSTLLYFHAQGSWAWAEEEDAQTITFIEGAIGKYVIKCSSSNGEAYLYDGADCVDRGSNLDPSSPSTDARYTSWILESAEANMANMRITDAGWGTFYAPFAVDMPAGVKAYTGEMQDGWIRMNELTNGYIPANTGVVVELVEGEPFETELSPMSPQPNEAAVESCYTGNTTGTTMAMEVGDYLLQKQNDVVGWYKVEGEGFTLARNRCYLAEGSVPEPNQSRTFFGFAPDDATGISSIATEAKTKADGKYMVNGQIVVVKAGKAYYMNGTEVK